MIKEDHVDSKVFSLIIEIIEKKKPSSLLYAALKRYADTIGEVNPKEHSVYIDKIIAAIRIEEESKVAKKFILAMIRKM